MLFTPSADPAQPLDLTAPQYLVTDEHGTLDRHAYRSIDLSVGVGVGKPGSWSAG